MFVFNKTTRGYSHINNDTVCEDFSASLASENGDYYIIAVADGHGAKECYRSSVGSRIACETTIEYLKEYIDSILSEDTNDDNMIIDYFDDVSIRRLTNSIVAGWYDRVLEHFKENPPNDEETKIYVSLNTDSEITHVYGTTLIAGVMIKNLLVLIQQGDGRCDVFFENGDIKQPIPWDKRCEYNVTTSLCDKDVATSIRTSLINLSDNPVFACFIGSDGVEDAYRDTYINDYSGLHEEMGGVHTFYKNILCKLYELDEKGFDAYISDMLPEFSEKGLFSLFGSGDDVSVAGIVNLDIIEKFYDEYKESIATYSRIEEIETKLITKKGEIGSKERKRGILKKRLDDSKQEYEEELKKINTIQESLNILIKDKEKLNIQVFNDVGISKNSKARKRNLKSAKVLKLNLDIASLQQIIDESKNKVEQLEIAYNDAEEKYNQYNERYMSIQNEIDLLEMELVPFKNDKA